MNQLDLGIIVLYVLVIIFVGVLVSRRVADARDFFLAGRSLPFWLIGLSIIGTNVTGDGYVGASGSAYRLGIAQANFDWIGGIPAMILAAFIFIPIYWRAGVYSIPEYLGLRYNQSVRVLAATILSVFMVFGISVMIWAMAVVLNTYFEWPIWLGITVTGAAVGIYSIAGGLTAVAVTDSLQVAIMCACSVIVLYIGIDDAGGVGAFADKLTAANPTHTQAFLPADHPEFPWPGVIFGLTLVLSPAYWCGSQFILQRTLGARSQWDASAGMMLAAIGKMFVPVLIIFPGLLAVVLQAPIDNSDMALPWVIKNVLPPGVSGLMFVALIAALQSSLDSALNSTSLMITRDIRYALLKNADKSNDLRLGRITSFAMLLFGMLFAPMIERVGGIYFFIQILFSVFQGPMLALLIMGAFSKRVTPVAGVFTLVSGVMFAAISMLLGVNMLFAAAQSFAFSMISLVAVSRFTAAKPLAEISHLMYRRPGHA